MATDYKVKYRTYDAVAELAQTARERLGIAHRYDFNIVHEIKRLVGQVFGEHGPLHLDLFTDSDELAYVTFNPLTLHVHREVWDDAALGEPKSRFILAHELGHILMHRHYRQEFSEDEKRHIKFVVPEERAETQANWFASAFLAPDDLARRCASESELCLAFNYPSEFIALKRHALKRKTLRLPTELCNCCGSFSVAGTWSDRRCSACGKSYREAPAVRG